MMLYTKKIFEKRIFENLFFLDPMTYLCNRLEPFEKFGRGPLRDHSC